MPVLEKREDVSCLRKRSLRAEQLGKLCPFASAQRGIENVLVCGVHLNMCVLGRPFAIRQMVMQGKHVALVRDLTDTMYNPERPPYVSHFAGTRLMIEHVEKYWCPTVTSSALLGGEPFRFRGDTE